MSDGQERVAAKRQESAAIRAMREAVAALRRVSDERDRYYKTLQEIADVSDDRADDPIYTRDVARDALEAKP